MASNPLRQLASMSRDIRAIGISKLPRNLQRACIIFYNRKSQLGERSAKTCLKIGKAAKYMQLDVFVLQDGTEDEFIETLRHFVSTTSEILLAFACGQNITQGQGTDGIPLSGGVADPDLVYDIFSLKPTESKVCFLTDAIFTKEAWDKEAPHGVLFMAPYPDRDASVVSQFDASEESFFAVLFNNFIKTNPDATPDDIATALEERLSSFGQKVFLKTFPPQFATEISFAL